MLSRTADNLYWVSRYLERADFLARLIEASSRIAALPKAYAAAQDEWQSVLIASGADETFYDHPRAPTRPMSSPISPSTRAICPASATASNSPAPTPAPCARR